MAKGFDEFIAKLESYGTDSMDKVAATVQSEGDAMTAQTQRLVRVRTGNWRSGVNGKLTRSAREVRYVMKANAFNKGFNYGYYQEHVGGSKVGPNNAVRAAFQTHSAALKQKLGGAK